jgi:lipopolysaccharide kinase (Kdo/WaaP) family protein
MGQFSAKRWALWLLSLALLFTLASGVIQVAGRHASQKYGSRYRDIALAGADATIDNADLRLCLARGAKPEPARVRELLEEHTQAVEVVLGLVRRFRRPVGAAELQAEFEESKKLAATLDGAMGAGDAVAQEQAAARLRTNLETLRDDLLYTTAAARGVLDTRIRSARRWQRIGFWLTVASFAMLFPLAYYRITQAHQEASGPIQLEAELDQLARTDVFRSRMRLLVPDADKDATWTLALTKILFERRPHVVFEAEARHGEHTVRLWGKRYRLIGMVKSLQHFFLPIYARATWRNLCAMYNAGIDAPVPVVWHPIRRKRVPVGSIILVEHVGEVQQVRTFVRSEIALLSPERRRAFLVRWAQYIRRLHEVHICHFKSRHFYGTHLDGEAESRLYLFDLDKVRLSRSGSQVIRRLHMRFDIRRLMLSVAEYVTPDELAAFEQSLRSSGTDA